MKEFKSEDMFHIPGRGNVKIVHIPNPNRVVRPEGTPDVGEHVIIDGEKYEVSGVETFMKLTYPPFAGENVGLLVKKLKD